MKNNVLRFIFSMAALSGTVDAAECCPNQQPCCSGVTTSNNTFLPRSFSSNSAREILMTKSMYDECRDSDKDAWYGTFTTAVEYSQNFGCHADKNLGTRPFWSGSNTMTYGTNDGKSDVDAYQFGMGSVSSIGEIKLDPRVQQVGVDMMLHFMQYLDKPGFYFKIRAPMVGLMIDPRMSEPISVSANTTSDLWSKYPGLTDRPRTLAEAFAGGSCGGNPEAPFIAMYGKKIVLEHGQISVKKMSIFRMADVSFAVGANITSSDKGLVGVGFKVATPTGNVAKCDEILEPIVGRGGHWAIGFESFGYYRIYEHDVDTFLTIRYQGELYHLAHGKTSFRSFDLLQNGPGSKYLLVQYYQHGSILDVFTPGFIVHAIHITTLPVRSKFNLEGSLAIMVDGNKNNWEYGIGGEIWGRSCETVSVDQAEAIKSHATAEFNNFAVLGRQRSEVPGAFPDRCEPLATMSKSENFDVALAAETDKIKDARLSKNRIPAAVCNALDIGSATARRAITGKLFSNIGYCWKDSNYKPHVSIYGSAEFSTDNNALNIWTVGVQGSLNF